MLNENYIESYTNLPAKDPTKDQTKGFRCIIEYDSLNEWNEPIKSFSVFPPQTIESPKNQEEFDWMLQSRLTQMQVAGYTNINIQDKSSSVWKRYTRSLNK